MMHIHLRHRVAGAVLLSLAASAAAAEDGKRIFLEGGGDLPACAICHKLADAGSSGEIGPSLDDLKPDQARVREAVTNGVGVMPAFGESLSEAEIEAVSAYVAEVAGR